MLSRRNAVGAAPQPSTAAPVATSSAYMGRLSRQQMAQIEARLPPRVTDNPILAAQYLGQQQVLQLLRSDFSE